jgi:hypothetical protein
MVVARKAKPKPLMAVAREKLLAIAHRDASTVTFAARGSRRPATWLGTA